MKNKKEYLMSKEDYEWYREYRKKYVWEPTVRKVFDRKRRK